MPILSRAKKKVGNALNSAAMNADARQTDFCVYLSAILLAGLLLNAAFGWWWADPVASLDHGPNRGEGRILWNQGETLLRRDTISVEPNEGILGPIWVR